MRYSCKGSLRRKFFRGKHLPLFGRAKIGARATKRKMPGTREKSTTRLATQATAKNTKLPTSSFFVQSVILLMSLLNNKVRTSLETTRVRQTQL